MVFIHESADVSKEATIGENSSFWNQVQVREGASIGSDCTLSKNVYIDKDVKIGNKVKIQNNVSVYHGVTLEDGVFVAPHVCFTNDMLPRSIDSEGNLKSDEDWTESKTLVKEGASIGANSTIVCGISIGRFALIGAGSVITKDVPDHGLVYGVPGKLKGFVCECASKLDNPQKKEDGVSLHCSKCNKDILISQNIYDLTLN